MTTYEHKWAVSAHSDSKPGRGVIATFDSRWDAEAYIAAHADFDDDRGVWIWRDDGESYLVLGTAAVPSIDATLK